MRLRLLVAVALALCAGMASATSPRSTELAWSHGNLLITDAVLSPSVSMWDDCPLLAIFNDPAVGSIFFDDFVFFVHQQNGWSCTLTNAGHNHVEDATGGLLYMHASDVTVADNDETYVGMDSYIGANSKVYVPTAGKDIWFEARVKFTEANVDDANVIAGLMSKWSADALIDNGGGPFAAYDGIVFFKVDGGTVWQAEASNGEAQTTLTSVATRQSGTWTRLGMFIDGSSSVTFYINGVAVGTTTTNLPDAGITPVFGVKNGDTNEEALYVDWVRVVQLR